jgi:hypothetical protein
MAETGLTPAIEDSVDQVVRDCMVLGNMLMALFAFPRAFQDICYLFEYSGHYLLGNVITAPFIDRYN